MHPKFRVDHILSADLISFLKVHQLCAKILGVKGFGVRNPGIMNVMKADNCPQLRLSRFKGCPRFLTRKMTNWA